MGNFPKHELMSKIIAVLCKCKNTITINISKSNQVNDDLLYRYIKRYLNHFTYKF